MGIFGKVTDTIVLGALWLMCSVPVVTIGASSSAFYYTYNKCVRQEREYAWRTFFTAFRSNFKQATQMWLMHLGMMLFTVVDYMILNAYSEFFPLGKLLMGLMIAAFVYLAMWGLYLFPYISRFENDTKAAGMLAGRMVMENLLFSVILLLIFGLLVLLVFLVPIMGLVAPAAYIPVANWILERIFKKYMTQRDLEKEASYTTEQKT